jgi:myosin-1
MTLLTTISNEAINENLQKRWTNAEIYTYIGNVLISVNPFRGACELRCASGCP